MCASERVRWVLRALVVVIGVACAGGSAWAAPDHGWAAVPLQRAADEADPYKAVLLHLPPRVSGESGEAGGRPGLVRQAVRLPFVPDEMAFWGNRVAMVLPPEEGPSGRQRRVLGLSAVRMFGAAWENEPSNRFDTLASLRGDESVLGFVGTRVGPMALVRSRGVEGTVRLLAAQPTRWAEVVLPWEEPGLDSERRPPDGAMALLGLRDAVGLVVAPWSGTEAELWVGTLVAGERDPRGSPVLRWERETLSFRRNGGEGTQVPAATMVPLVFSVGDRVLASTVAGDRLDLWLVQQGGMYPLIRLADIPASRAVVSGVPGAGSAGHVVVVWEDIAPLPATGASGDGGNGAGGAPQAAMPRPADRRTFIVTEISVATGEVVYEGPARFGSLISPREFQFVSLLMIAIMIAVVAFVLRPEGMAVPAVPKGWRAADLPARFSAAVFDLLPALVVTGWILGVSPLAVLSPRWLVGPMENAVPLLLAWGVVTLHCAMGEWLFGCSIGKSLLGLRVKPVRVRAAGGAEVRENAGAETGEGAPKGAEAGVAVEASRGISLWQAIARNAIRWGLPPLSLFALREPLGRTPADFVAGTVTLRELDEEEERPGGR